MTPCCRLYGVIGLELAAAYPDAQHLYRDWIATYSSRGYLSVPDAQEALLDRIGASSQYGALYYACPAGRGGALCNPSRLWHGIASSQHRGGVVPTPGILSEYTSALLLPSFSTWIVSSMS